MRQLETLGRSHMNRIFVKAPRVLTDVRRARGLPVASSITRGRASSCPARRSRSPGVRSRFSSCPLDPLLACPIRKSRSDPAHPVHRRAACRIRRNPLGPDRVRRQNINQANLGWGQISNFYSGRGQLEIRDLTPERPDRSSGSVVGWTPDSTSLLVRDRTDERLVERFST
jgi:hypothetical protein